MPVKPLPTTVTVAPAGRSAGADQRLGGLVAVDVERPLDAGQRRPVETAAQRDHQTVVGQRLALGQRHPPRLDVDSGHARQAKRHTDPVQHGRQR